MSQEYGHLVDSELKDITTVLMHVLREHHCLNSKGVAAMLALSSSMIVGEPNAEDHQAAKECVEILARRPVGTTSLLAQMAKGIALAHLGVYKATKGS